MGGHHENFVMASAADWPFLAVMAKEFFRSVGDIVPNDSYLRMIRPPRGLIGELDMTGACDTGGSIDLSGV